MTVQTQDRWKGWIRAEVLHTLNGAAVTPDNVHSGILCVQQTDIQLTASAQQQKYNMTPTQQDAHINLNAHQTCTHTFANYPSSIIESMTKSIAFADATQSACPTSHSPLNSEPINEGDRSRRWHHRVA